MRIVFSRTAQKALVRSNKRKLPLEKIAQLASQPDTLANNITQLRGRDEWRLRVQDWRVIYVRQDDQLLIRDVAPRASIYED